MLAYAVYQRNTHQGAAWEKYWYEDSGDYYLGYGMPESISAGPTLDLTGRMSRAFVLAADPEIHKQTMSDPDLKRLNELLAEKEQDAAARVEISELREKLGQRYPAPVVEPGGKVFAAEDDEYKKGAYELQYGDGDMIPGVGHTVPKTKLGAIFASEAAAREFSRHGAYSYELTADPAPPGPKNAVLSLADRLWVALKR